MADEQATPDAILQLGLAFWGSKALLAAVELVLRVADPGYFYRLHADSVEVLRVDTREHALEAGREALDLLEYATGLFLTGRIGHELMKYQIRS